MTKKVRDENNFVDALRTEHHFVVLTKEGRVQILVKPTSKQLRRRGKRGWRLHGTVERGDESDQTLVGMIQEAIRGELQRAVPEKRRKGKSSASSDKV